MTEGGTDNWKELHDRAGAVWATIDGVPVARHYGDPASEYRAATQGVAIIDHSHRYRFVIHGRAPGQMLKGVVTGRIPPMPTGGESTGLGERAYSTVLTPKGRMVSDLFLTRVPGDDEQFVMDVPAAGAAGLTEYLAKVMPPRFAKVEDVTDLTRSLTFVGPEAASGLAAALARPESVAQELDQLENDQVMFFDGASATPVPLFAARNPDVGVDAFTVVGPAAAMGEAFRKTLEAGRSVAGWGVWETLRVQAGTPRFGADMGERTIPVEAGIDVRAIDHTKGCYTGQEVIVRIRDRGHVNRHLRRLAFTGTTAPGDELRAVGGDKVVGEVTSAVESPESGTRIGLGYVRREIEVGTTLQDGVTVVA